jgi:hypothetical protein
MINEIAPIYRRLIYEYLETEDLVAIGKTCRTIYNDSFRTRCIIEKISCLFGYKVEETNECFHYTLMPPSIIEHVKEEFEKRTLSIEFSDIDKLSLEEKKKLVITFPLELFFMMDIRVQKRVVGIFIDHIYKLSEYIDTLRYRDQIDLYPFGGNSVRQTDLYPFYEFVNRTVCTVFIKGKYTVRLYIMALLISADCAVDKKTKYSLTEYFLYSLFEGKIFQLELMIEVGLFLRKNFPHFVKNYFYYCLSSYMDNENTEYDDVADTVEKILDEKNSCLPELSNAQLLENMLLEYINIFNVRLIRDISKERRLRYYLKNETIKSK